MTASRKRFLRLPTASSLATGFRRQLGDGAGDRPRREVGGAWGVLAVMVFLSVHAISKYFSTEATTDDHITLFQRPLDLRVYYEASKTLQEGYPLYAHGLVGGPMGLPFTYPPFAGVVLWPLSNVPVSVLSVVWQSCSLLALVCVVFAIFVERRYSMTLPWCLVVVGCVIASLNLSAIYGTFYFGQINIFLMLLVAIDVLRKRDVATGVGTGLAAGIKLTPAIFVLDFVLERRWWACLVSVVTFAATVWIGYLFIPDAHQFWTSKIFETNRIGDQNNPGALSLAGVFTRDGLGEKGWQWIAACVVVVLVCGLACLGALRRKNRSMVFAFIGITSCLVSPFAWFHHWVWVVPLALIMIDDALSRFTAIVKKLGVHRFVSWPLMQLAGFVISAVVTWILLPEASFVSNFNTSYQAQADSSLWFVRGASVYVPCAVMIFYALRFSLIDGGKWVMKRSAR